MSNVCLILRAAVERVIFYFYFLLSGNYNNLPKVYSADQEVYGGGLVKTSAERVSLMSKGFGIVFDA